MRAGPALALALVVATVPVTAQAARAAHHPAVVIASPSATTTTVGVPVTVRGTVRHRPAHGKLSLQEHTGGRWLTLARIGPARRLPSFSIPYTPTAVGAHELRILVHGAGHRRHSKPFVVTASPAAPVGSPARQVAAAYEGACAVVGTGQVRCWGTLNLADPWDATSALVPGVTNAVSVSVGLEAACALLSDGTIACWGSDEYGQLGNGTISDHDDVFAVPVRVTGIDHAVGVASGQNHACALLASGAVSCWGAATAGQLGAGAPPSPYSATPAPVTGISTAVAVVAGTEHTCALLHDGTVQCWGSDYYDQLGNGAGESPSDLPVTVQGLTGVASLGAGENTTCAVLTTSAVACWGLNREGQTGQPQTSFTVPTPMVVQGLSAVSVTGGDEHSCAVLADGGEECWGSNEWGEFGSGAWSDPTPIPTRSLITGVVETTAGDENTCALVVTGAVHCWGDNTFGQVGSGDINVREYDAPVPVDGIP